MISASTKRVPRPVRVRRAAWVRADGGHTKGSGMERDLLSRVAIHRVVHAAGPATLRAHACAYA